MTTPDLAHVDAMIASTPRQETKPRIALDSWAEMPLLPEEALYGPIGEVVRAIAQDSEASPAGLLGSVITTVGAMLGRGPHCLIEGAPHHARFMTMLVGPSSTGRKGVAMHHGVDRVIAAIDPAFRSRVITGVSSGEGLIEAVRDAAPAVPSARADGDPGISDKRLLVKLGEAAGLFKALEQKGSTLSARLREAFDGDRMQNASRQSPVVATDPHICIIAGITPTEFRRSLTSAEIMNGLANRIMPMWCEREQFLPFGGSAPGPWLLHTLEALKAAVETARHIGLVTWTEDGRDWWAKHYAEISTPRASGALGTLLARGAPIVQRLGLLFAVLDGKSARSAVHMAAANAVWKYIEATWRALYATGELLSDRAQLVLSALEHAGPEGINKSVFREVLGSGNISANEIDSVLGELRGCGLARPHRKAGKYGRPAENWVSVRHLSGDGRNGRESG